MLEDGECADLSESAYSSVVQGSIRSQAICVSPQLADTLESETSKHIPIALLPSVFWYSARSKSVHISGYFRSGQGNHSAYSSL